MRGLVVATCRLPHASVEDLETARAHLAHPDRLQAATPEPIFTLATCQRVLVAAHAPDHPDPSGLVDGLAGAVGVPGLERLVGFDALHHLAEVASSLDALVPGEGQVPGQFREAVREHVHAGRIGAPLHGTLQRVMAIARSVRSEAGFTGQPRRSLADLAAPLLDPHDRVALLGTGQMARAALTSLGAPQVHHVISTDPDRADTLTPEHARAWERGSFLADPPPVDALVLCTRAGSEPVLPTEDVERLLRARDQASRPLLVLDLGLPRNADPAIASLAEVDLRTIGDLARVARGRLLEDPSVATAREALARAIQQERQRHAHAQLEAQIVGIREAIQEELDGFVETLATEHPDLDPAELRERIHRTRGRLAHRCQEHLVQAARGEPPA